jgi:hypothetical protein
LNTKNYTIAKFKFSKLIFNFSTPQKYPAIADHVNASDQTSLSSKTSNHNQNLYEVLSVNQLTTSPNMMVFITDISGNYKDLPPSYREVMSDNSN